MQGTQVQLLVWEGSACHGVTKPMYHRHEARALEVASHSYWRLRTLQPVLRNRRSYSRDKSTHRTREKSLQSNEGPVHL